MRNFYHFILLFVFSLTLLSQKQPGIGLSFLPANTSSICPEPVYSGGFYSSGYQQGDTVQDFKLYALNGDSLFLSQALSAGKPALLIAGSLTCPVFRAKVPTINQVINTYSATIDVYIIYTIEAHPTDTSVYFGYVNVTSQNTAAGILFSSPQTYSDRLKMADTMNTFLSLNAPVYIDGPCNNWWKNFGPAPNNSYLIDTNGVVLNKHGWFHKFPDNIFCDLDSIFNLNSGLCNNLPGIPGNFKINIISDSVVGIPGDLLYDYVDVVNTSSVSTIIKIKKLQKSLPFAWQTMFCADVCYSASDDSIEVSVDPFDTLHFSLDFLTGTLPDSGSVRVGFRNVFKPNNSFALWLKASSTFNDVGIDPHRKSAQAFIYPNPTSGHFTIDSETENITVTVYNSFGQIMPFSHIGRKIDISHLPGGIYFLNLKSATHSLPLKIVLQRQ